MNDQPFLQLELPRAAARELQPGDPTKTDSGAVATVPVPREDAEPSLLAFAASIRTAVQAATAGGGGGGGSASRGSNTALLPAAGSAAAAAGSGGGDEQPACWYLLEYCCFGQAVPLLSDEALREAFSYFREQHQQEQQQQCTSGGADDSPRAAAAAPAGTLTLLPTMAQPPWTLHTYLAAKAAAAAASAGSGSGGSAAKAGMASSKPQRSRRAGACLDLQQPMKAEDGGNSTSSGEPAATGSMLLQVADTSAREADQQTAGGGGWAGSSAKSSKVSKSTHGSTPRSEEQQQEQQQQQQQQALDIQQQLAAAPVPVEPTAAGARQHCKWLGGFGGSSAPAAAAAGAGVASTAAVEPAAMAVPGCFPRLVSSGSGGIRQLLGEVPAPPFLAAGGGLENSAWQAAAAAAAAAAAVAAAAAAVEPGSGPAAMDLLLQQKQQLLAVQPVPLVSLGPRGRTETRTKYADGRFKDELRHQQRLTEMDEKCGQLFGGAIRGHFKIEHHKRIICLVCQSLVTPYEAYHVDALRKHFVRHHTPWLAGRGAGTLTCWPPGGSSSSNTSSTTPAATAVVTREAAAAAGRGTGSALAAAAAAPPAPAAPADAGHQGKAPHNSRQSKGFRTADGRYLDPVLHAQRLTNMHQTAAGLFGGCIAELFRINSHKSITCLACNQDVTPYAAYHADCLRKHFVRHHTDMLRAAGVDVLAYSRGIQLGKRKLRELQAEQQASQQQEAQPEPHTQQQQQQQQQEEEGDCQALPEQPQSQQQHSKQVLSQLPTVTGVLMSNGQLLLLPPLPLSAVAAAAAAAAGSAAPGAPGSSNGMQLLQSSQQPAGRTPAAAGAFSGSAGDTSRQKTAGNGSNELLLETSVLPAPNQAGSCGLPAAVELANSRLQPGSPQLQPPELPELSARSSSLSDQSSAADEPAATAAAGSAHACCQVQQQWPGSMGRLLHSSSSSSRCPSLGPDAGEDAAATAAAATGVSQALMTVSESAAAATQAAGSGLCLMQEDWPLLEGQDFMELLDSLSSDDPDACFGLDQMTGEGAGFSAEDAREMWPGTANRWPLG